MDEHMIIKRVYVKQNGHPRPVLTFVARARHENEDMAEFAIAVCSDQQNPSHNAGLKIAIKDRLGHHETDKKRSEIRIDFDDVPDWRIDLVQKIESINSLLSDLSEEPIKYKLKKKKLILYFNMSGVRYFNINSTEYKKFKERISLDKLESTANSMDKLYNKA